MAKHLEYTTVTDLATLQVVSAASVEWNLLQNYPSLIGKMKNAEVSDVRSLSGVTNYVASFIRGYADIEAPLHNLTHKSV